MKRIIVAFLVILATSNVNGQLTKGTWLLGGNIAYSHTKYNSDAVLMSPQSVISISPNIGYFFADRFVAGMHLSYERVATKTSESYASLSGGPFVRYYLLSINKPYNVLVQGDYQIGRVTGEGTKGMDAFAFDAGPVIFLSNNVGLEFLIGYSSFKYFEYHGRNNTIKTSIGLQIHFGRKN